MFRLHEIEKCDEDEIATRILAQIHMHLDTKFPHTKADVSDAFKETAFSIVEDTISDGDPKKAGTPGIPETRDTTPITKASTRVGDNFESDREQEFSHFNEELGENTQFSLDEPTMVTESDIEIKEKGFVGPLTNMLVVFLILLAIAAAAFYFLQRGV